MKDLQVLLVAHQYWPTPGSGSQRLGALVGELMQAGATVQIVTHRSTVEEELTHGPNGERIHYVADPEQSGAGWKRAMHLSRFAFAVLRQARRMSLDIVITDPPPTAAWAALAIARIKGIPLIYYMSDSWAMATKGAHRGGTRFAHLLLAAFEKPPTRGAAVVVAVTPGLAEHASRAGAETSILVPNGVPLAMYPPSGPTWKPSTSGVPFFLYAGNAGYVHGAEVFAAASENLWSEGFEFKLVYMGYGANHATILRVREEWPAHLLIIPNQPPSVVAAAYRGAVGALSSLRPNDAYADARPIKSMAGLAAGCPPIYAGSGEFAQFLTANGLGYVSPWSVAGAEASMRFALESSATSDWRERMRDECSRIAAEHFDIRCGAATVARKIESVVWPVQS